MTLYFAEVYLHRVHHFRAKAELAKDAQCISDIDDGCRYDELAVAEAVATNGPTSPC